MKITRSTLKSLIREEMNRARTLNESNREVDAGLVFAQWSPRGAVRASVESAWDAGDYASVLEMAAAKGFTPETAYDYFTTAGEGLDFGSKHTVEAMFPSYVQTQGIVAALDWAMKEGAFFNMPGLGILNQDMPFDLDSMVNTKASEQ